MRWKIFHWPLVILRTDIFWKILIYFEDSLQNSCSFILTGCQGFKPSTSIQKRKKENQMLLFSWLFLVFGLLSSQWIQFVLPISFLNFPKVINKKEKIVSYSADQATATVSSHHVKTSTDFLSLESFNEEKKLNNAWFISLNSTANGWNTCLWKRNLLPGVFRHWPGASEPWGVFTTLAWFQWDHAAHTAACLFQCLCCCLAQRWWHCSWLCHHPLPPQGTTENHPTCPAELEMKDAVCFK